ncbi:MAG: PEP-CTERM sorting domain-containing protein [Chloroflexi bacterium]|nr:PEP-CTERM sorting domain-containing protein [Chloroflexota bacterium]
MTKMKTAILRAAVLVATSLLCGASALASTVYENSASPPDKSYAPAGINGIEFGDEIDLAGTDRVVTEFQFEYFLKLDASGNEMARLAVYAMDGPVITQGSASPGTLLYDSGNFTLASGYNRTTLPPTSFTTPNSITWAVTFSGLDAGEDVGLLLSDTPQTGASFRDFWQRDSNGNWGLFEMDSGATKANFVAKVTAVPEPGTLALLAGGLAWLGFLGYRRKI